MKIEKFLLSVIKNIEKKYPQLFVYAYMNGNESMDYSWWEVSVSSYLVYSEDDFKRLSRRFSNIAKSQGEKVIFVCSWVPDEEKLVRLSNDNNLILNI